jgi:hypothetical protein
MPVRAELAGQSFGLWKVLRYHGSSGQGAMWVCRCECGTERPTYASALLHGKSLSCGCVRPGAERHGHNRRFGGGRSPTYKAWANMLRRCKDPNHPSFRNYGGKGIGVCAEWLKFENFLRDMGERPEGKTLDRKDGSKGYNKSNCRWQTMLEQGNNRSNNRRIAYMGETHTVAQWARILRIKEGTIRARLSRGFTDIEALQP